MYECVCVCACACVPCSPTRVRAAKYHRLNRKVLVTATVSPGVAAGCAVHTPPLASDEKYKRRVRGCHHCDTCYRRRIVVPPDVIREAAARRSP